MASWDYNSHTMSRNNTPTLADAGRLAQHALEV